MGETADRIIVDIEQARTDLKRDLSALETEVRREANWKVQFRKHPYAFLAGAIMVGLLIASLAFGE